MQQGRLDSSPVQLDSKDRRVVNLEMFPDMEAETAAAGECAGGELVKTPQLHFRGQCGNAYRKAWKPRTGKEEYECPELYGDCGLLEGREVPTHRFLCTQKFII